MFTGPVLECAPDVPSTIVQSLTGSLLFGHALLALLAVDLELLIVRILFQTRVQSPVMVAALEDHHETVGLGALGELLCDAATLGDGEVAQLLS